MREPLLLLDAQLRVVAANAPFVSAFQVSAKNSVGKFLRDLGDGQWDIPKLRTLLEQVLHEKQPVADFEVEHNFDRIGRKIMLLNVRQVAQPEAQYPMVLVAIEDITERKLTEAALIRSVKLAAAGRLAGTLAHEINNPLQAITNLLAVMQQSPDLDDQNRGYVNLAAEELNRVAHLTRQSLSFYRGLNFAFAGKSGRNARWNIEAV